MCSNVFLHNISMSVPATCHILGNQYTLLQQSEKKQKRLFSSLAFFFFFLMRKESLPISLQLTSLKFHCHPFIPPSITGIEEEWSCLRTVIHLLGWTGCYPNNKIMSARKRQWLLGRQSTVSVMLIHGASSNEISSVQSLSHVWLFATLWTAAHQASLSITNSQSCSNSCPSSWWWHPTISSYVIPFSSCLQSFIASGSFLKSQFFASGGQSIGASASASVLQMNIQD